MNHDLLRRALAVCPVKCRFQNDPTPEFFLTVVDEPDGDFFEWNDEHQWTRDCEPSHAESSMTAAWLGWLASKCLIEVHEDFPSEWRIGFVLKPNGYRRSDFRAPTLVEALAEAVCAVGENKEKA